MGRKSIPDGRHCLFKALSTGELLRASSGHESNVSGVHCSRWGVRGEPGNAKDFDDGAGAPSEWDKRTTSPVLTL